MNYFIVREINEGYERLYESDRKVAKGDYVVIANYDDVPVTAEVLELVSKYQALTSSRKPEPIIDSVNIKEWKANREKQLDNAILLDKMQEKVQEIKTLEVLEKYAGKDPAMLELLNQYKGQSSIDDNEDNQEE